MGFIGRLYSKMPTILLSLATNVFLVPFVKRRWSQMIENLLDAVAAEKRGPFLRIWPELFGRGQIGRTRRSLDERVVFQDQDAG